ncbi:MAG: hydrogen peroxide-inducible genes activator [Myxococcales bacterium]|jgi:LysR family hydrogen peroxide-inducible transcriptional activator
MDIEQVTLTQMRYAVAIGETGSFRLAAERCHISQSGLSMQIQRLEELLGAVLFDRSRKPVRVTQAGEAALSQMRSVLRETERLGQVVAEDVEPSGRFRLGVIPTLAPTVLPLFLRQFVQRNPRVELIVEELKTEEIVARLQSDTLDAGLAATPLSVPGLREEALGHEALVAYLPPGDPLLKKRSVSQKDLAERHLWVLPEGHCFRSQVLTFCRSDHAPRPGPVQFESGSFETLIHLVDDGFGATVLPALTADAIPARRRRAQARPLSGPPPVREIGLVTARTDLRRRVSEAIAGCVRERLQTALGPPPRRAQVLDPLPQP